jgi:hypothetical protein
MVNSKKGYNASVVLLSRLVVRDPIGSFPMPIRLTRGTGVENKCNGDTMVSFNQKPATIKVRQSEEVIANEST